MMRLLRWRPLRWAAVLVAIAFGAIQLVPYGREHDNPPVSFDVPWPSAEAEELAVDACYDCHSNETEWPFYSWVAPMSWLVTDDVEKGREELNFSEEDPDYDDALEAVEDGNMPLQQYVLLHPDARLSESERQTLADALEALDDGDEGGDGDNSGPGSGGDGDDGDGDNSGPGGGGDEGDGDNSGPGSG